MGNCKAFFILCKRKSVEQNLVWCLWYHKDCTKKDGKVELVDISKVVCEEKPMTSNFYRERFENAGALSTHIKCKHSVVIS